MYIAAHNSLSKNSVRQYAHFLSVIMGTLRSCLLTFLVFLVVLVVIELSEKIMHMSNLDMKVDLIWFLGGKQAYMSTAWFYLPIFSSLFSIIHLVRLHEEYVLLGLGKLVPLSCNWRSSISQSVAPSPSPAAAGPVCPAPCVCQRDSQLSRRFKSWLRRRRRWRGATCLLTTVIFCNRQVKHKCQ